MLELERDKIREITGKDFSGSTLTKGVDVEALAGDRERIEGLRTAIKERIRELELARDDISRAREMRKKEEENREKLESGPPLLGESMVGKASQVDDSKDDGN